MEKKRLVVKKEDRDLYVELNKIFMWNLDEENNLNERKILLNFSRDESVPHLNEIKVVEMDYQVSVIPLGVALIPAYLAFILMTVVLFIFIFNREILKPLILMGCFLFPDFALLGLAVFLTYLRNKQIEKCHLNKAELLKNAKTKVDEILSK